MRHFPATLSPCLTVCLLLSAGARAQAPPDLTPAPKELTAKPGEAALVMGSMVLVVGDAAAEPERYAAQRLQELVARRYGVTPPVCAESAVPGGATPLVLLGQLSTNTRLRQLCERRQVHLWEAAAPADAYALEVLPTDRTVALCGSNPRSVIYGAQTLFRLLEQGEGALRLPAVSVRDWPTIAWRGRPHAGLEAHLEPGAMDAYLWAGLNFIDVRAGAFGYGPDAKLDTEQIGRCLREAHRRGLFVYGTVSCGVRPSKFEGALRVFGELADLGVDGLWISFDDPGGGEGTMTLVARAVALGKERGFTGRAIATTSALGSYQVIETDFNRELVKVPGMAEATWFFTRNPCADDLAAARHLGLQSLPAWWHNWPRTEGGFTHGSYGGTSFRPGGQPSYLEAPPLTSGWHKPDYEKLRDAGKNTDTVMMWGGWQPEYTCAVLGLWAWDPAGHDFTRTRRAIYRTVYGPSSVEKMLRLDDALQALKTYFLLPERAADPEANFPARLRAGAKVEEARALLDEAQRLEGEVAQAAPAETLLTPERLQAQFLEPLHAELQAARVLATSARPESWWPAHEAAVLARLSAGDHAGVEQLSAAVRPQLQRELSALREGLAGLVDLAPYEKLWSQRAAGGEAYWRGELKRRAEALSRRLAGLKAGGLDPEAMLAPLQAPPAGATLVGTVPPQQLAASPQAVQGAWLTGLYPSAEPQAFVMSFPGRTASTPGDLCQVTVRFPRPHCEGKLHLQLFLTDEYDSAQWQGYRFYQLLHGERVLWQEDIALTRRGGKEWSDVDLSALQGEGEELELTLRLIDRRGVGNYPTTILVGPWRLVEVR